MEMDYLEGRKMNAGTVFPEAVMAAAGTFAATLENASDDWPTDLSEEEPSDAVSLLRVLRKNLQHFSRDMKRFLSRGVETSLFVKRWQPILDRYGNTSAGVLKIAKAIRARGSAPNDSVVISELEGMGEDIGAAMNFLRELLALMKARRPIDWIRVEAAQAAYKRGEMKLFQGIAGADADSF